MTSAVDFPLAYARYLPPVRAKCQRMLGRSSAAEDVAQEAFTRLWQVGPKLDGGHDPRAVMAWLYLTSTRLALDLLRRERRSPLVDEDAGPLPCNTSLTQLVSARAALAQLAHLAPADELEAVLLARVDALPQAQIAELLGVSERTVRRLLDRFDQRSRALREEFTSS